jgi:kynureninase
MGGYFLYHSIGLYPGKAERTTAALAEVAECWGRADDSQWPRSLQIRARFLDRWQRLIGAPAGTLTTAENVTTAVYSMMGALPPRLLAGRQVLVAADCFPSLHFLLAGMAERRGFELVTAPLRDGECWVRDEDVLARWGPRVAVALLTWVTSTSSHRCDVRRLVAHGRSQGSVVGVDITLGVGILPFRVPEVAADFVVSTSLKWLCGVAGAGILQVQEALLRECRPELRGWFSQENVFSWELDSFRYAPDARRFDHGTPSILACAACLPALEWHANEDPMSLLAHNRRMVEILVDGAAALGLEVASPRRADERGGSLMLRLPEGVDPSSLVASLRERELYTDHRGPILRLSPGNLTQEDDVSRLLRGLRDLLPR